MAACGDTRDDPQDTHAATTEPAETEKLQAAQDPDSAAMVDYIIRNHIYDLAYFGDFGLPILIHNGLSSKQDSIASSFKTQEKIANKTLSNIINAYNRHK